MALYKETYILKTKKYIFHTQKRLYDYLTSLSAYYSYIIYNELQFHILCIGSNNSQDNHSIAIEYLLPPLHKGDIRSRLHSSLLPQECEPISNEEASILVLQ